jgi:hypothetical protein
MERPLITESVAQFADITAVPLPTDFIIMLIAADATNIPTETISRVAEHLLASRLVYLCAWGADCERVHDIFDEVHVGDASIESTFTLMTTWHADEPLEEAAWFFLNCAFPSDAPVQTASYVAVAVGHPEWAAAISELGRKHLTGRCS